LVLLQNYFRGFEFETGFRVWAKDKKKGVIPSKTYLCGSSLHQCIEKFVEVLSDVFRVSLFLDHVKRSAFPDKFVHDITIRTLSGFDDYNRPYNFAFYYGLSK
jgi:hypothetical protein